MSTEGYEPPPQLRPLVIAVVALRNGTAEVINFLLFLVVQRSWITVKRYAEEFGVVGWEYLQGMLKTLKYLMGEVVYPTLLNVGLFVLIQQLATQEALYISKSDMTALGHVVLYPILVTGVVIGLLTNKLPNVRLRYIIKSTVDDVVRLGVLYPVIIVSSSLVLLFVAPFVGEVGWTEWPYRLQQSYVTVGSLVLIIVVYIWDRLMRMRGVA